MAPSEPFTGQLNLQTSCPYQHRQQCQYIRIPLALGHYQNVAAYVHIKGRLALLCNLFQLLKAATGVGGKSSTIRRARLRRQPSERSQPIAPDAAAHHVTKPDPIAVNSVPFSWSASCNGCPALPRNTTLGNALAVVGRSRGKMLVPMLSEAVIPFIISYTTTIAPLFILSWLSRPPSSIEALLSLAPSPSLSRALPSRH